MILDFSEIINLPFINALLTLPKIKTYVVGGMVRDKLLNIESKDYDLVIEGITDDELKDLLSNYGAIISVEGRAFGVYKFRQFGSDLSFDIALPRREWYEVGMRRKNALVETKNVTINDDLSRRDFTMNAMAVDLKEIDQLKVKSEKSKEGSRSSGIVGLLDPFGGLKDLEQGVIRAVGNPGERFLEDPTRILRGIRFAVRFGFQIDDGTQKAMRELRHEVVRKFKPDHGLEIERVSWEMIGLEFLRTLENNPALTLEFYDEIGLLPVLLPEVEAMKGVEQPAEFHLEGDVFVHTNLALTKLPKNTSTTVKLALLFHDVGKVYTFQSAKETGDRIRFNNHDVIGAEKTEEILKRLKYPKKLIDDVTWLISKHMKLAYSFPKMRLDKKKNFARNPLFGELIQLVCADALATIHVNGVSDCSFLKPAEETLRLINEEAKAKRKPDLLNGDEIIGIIKEEHPTFDEQKEGIIVGKIKKVVNSKYDLMEFKTKEDGAEWVRKNFQGFYRK